VYSPISFFKKTDPEGNYIKKYIPVLRNMPKEFIYEPHKAPKSVQEKAKCIIGKDYPLPIVDHAHISKVNIEKMKKAFE
jgi:cryptochrome